MADMEYRKLPHGGEEISIIGFGTGFNEFPDHEAMVNIIRSALDSGINLLDLTPWDARMLGAFGEALRGRREDAYLQMHFGSDYPSGTYERIHGLDKVKKAVQWQMEQVGTDYIDFGFIHCLDDPQVLEDEFSNGTIDYLPHAVHRQQDPRRRLPGPPHVQHQPRLRLPAGAVRLRPD